MTNPDYTALLFVIDRSGSMYNISKEMEGGIKALLEEQGEIEGKVTVDIAYFDDRFDYEIKGALVADASVQIIPRGLTALYDAIGRATTEFGTSLAALDEDSRPGKVLVVIVTDGLENASHEFSVADVKSIISEQKDKYAWEFVFLGANQDAVETASSFGISRDNSLTYEATADGATSMSVSLGNYTRSFRTSGSAAFSDEDRTV